MPATFTSGFEVPTNNNFIDDPNQHDFTGLRPHHVGNSGYSALDLDFENTLNGLEYETNSFNFGQSYRGGITGGNTSHGGDFQESGYGSLPLPNHSAHYQQHQPLLPHYLQSANSFRDPNSLSPSVESYQSHSPSHYGSYGNNSDRRPSTTSSTLKQALESGSPSPARDSRSAAVGKAPNNTIRSRSARRASTSGPAPYTTGATPTSSYATGSTPTSSNLHSTPSLLIGSSKSIGSPAIPLAMSMPAFPSHGSAGSLSGNWFSNRSNFSAQALELSASFGTNPYLNTTVASPPSPDTVAPVPVVVKVKKVKVKKEEWEDDEGLEEIEEDDEGDYAPVSKSKGGKKALEQVPEEKLEEKKRKRRESHNLVERRRRDNINDRICELAALIPSDFLTEEEVSLKISNISLNSKAAASKTINKGIILSKSVEFITYLMKQLEEQSETNQSLQKIIIQLRLDQDDNMQH